MPVTRKPRQSRYAEAATGDTGGAETLPQDSVWQHPRVATMLPAELLQGGEIIVLLIKPSPWSILIRSARPLAVLATVIACLLWLRNFSYITALARRDLMFLGMAGGLLYVFWQFLEWLSRVYVLTDRRVIRVKGVVRVQVFEAPLRQIQHTETIFSLPERLMGLGTITFATAGTGGVEAAWEMIASPLETHQTVVKTLNRYR